MAVDSFAPGVSPGMAEAVKYVVRSFLDEKHYRTMHQNLSTEWNRMNSLSAAMKLMEQYGVYLQPAEVERIAAMEESAQINVLVTKMPQQSNEQFQHFFLQLQLLVSTATRVRLGLESGKPELVEEALNDADSTGIAPYILRMAIVQAGSEVSALKRQHEAWVRETDAKLGKMIRGQSDAIEAQKKLAAAQAQLSSFQTSQNEKMKKVLMGFASGCASAMLHSCFEGWIKAVKQGKAEAAIRAEYEEQLDAASHRLTTYKAEQLKGVRSAMQRKAAGLEGDLVADVWKIWVEHVEHEKDVRENADKVQEMEDKLKKMKEGAAKNKQSVFARMNQGKDDDLVRACWKAFIDFHNDYQRNKELEDQVKQTEKQLAEFMKNKSDGAKSMMSSIAGASNTGLLSESMKGWRTVVEDAKKEAELAEALAAAESKFSGFGSRNGKSARSVMERQRIQGEQMIQLNVIVAWRREARVEFTLRSHHHKVDAKRQQLVGVQHMFRNFAKQLEAGLQDGADAGTDFKDVSRRRQMHKGHDGAQSLPDIAQKQSSRSPVVSNTPKSGRSRNAQQQIDNVAA